MKEQSQLQGAASRSGAMSSFTRTEFRSSTGTSTNQIKKQNNVQISAQICHSHCNKTSARSFFSKAYTPCYRTFIASYFFYFILELLVLKINMTNAVPDLAPSLLDSNFVQPANLQLLF
jgi:hypothetical protein